MGERALRVTVRVIPRLDIKGPNLVKGVHLEGLRVVGLPESFARHYYETGADELLYMDVVASLYGRNSILEIVERTARSTFIPLTVGGGIRTLDDIKDVLRSGADKVAVNTAAVSRPDFIREAANRFGSSTIVVSIEAIEVSPGRFEVFTDNGREETGLEVIDWAERTVEMGAGEVMITSVDREGTGQGFHLKLTRQVVEAVSVPVIACGGAGSSAHVVEVVRETDVEAVSVASILHYGAVGALASHDQIENEGNTEFLRQAGSPKRITPASIGVIKDALASNGFECRPEVPT